MTNSGIVGTETNQQHFLLLALLFTLGFNNCAGISYTWASPHCYKGRYISLELIFRTAQISLRSTCQMYQVSMQPCLTFQKKRPFCYKGETKASRCDHNFKSSRPVPSIDTSLSTKILVSKEFHISNPSHALLLPAPAIPEGGVEQVLCAKIHC